MFSLSFFHIKLRKVFEVLSNKSDRTPSWVIVLLFISLFLGLSVRYAFVLDGHPSLSSDEVNVYHYFQSLQTPEGRSNFLYWHWDPRELRYLIFYFLFALSGKHLASIGFIAGTINSLICLLWTFVLFRRTKQWVAIVPSLLFLALPAPCVSCWGTMLCELRPSVLYGVVLVGFAGTWFTRPIYILLFAVVSGWGCGEDFFTLSFIVPVLLYEMNFCFQGTWTAVLKRCLLFLLGAGAAFSYSFSHSWMGFEFHNGYMQHGIAPPQEWLRHLNLLTEMFPAYWLGGVPLGYIQNSQLGRWLNPLPPGWFPTLTIFLFWPLVLWGLFGTLSFFKQSENRKEAILWYGPASFLLLFFIFGRQVWDALTLRYLEYFQYLLPALFGFYALSPGIKSWSWKVLLIFWMTLHGAMLAFGFHSNSGQHPAQRIASCLEEMGVTAGFSDYWVSEPVRYFSEDRVLLNPYNAPPLDRRPEIASKTSKKIALVWLRGLDRPNLWDEVNHQIQSLNYHPLFKRDYQDEGWSILVWEKNKK